MSSSNFFSNALLPDEQKRLDRQLRLPGWNQALLKKSAVLIAGVGGLGTEIAKNLAMVGVGTIHLVDMDYIEHSNLNRQILFIEAEEGESKAEAAAKMLAKINPYGKYIPHFKALQELDPEIFESVDLYISGLDSVRARQDLNRMAVIYGKPLVDGGTATFHGHVYSYIPNQNACLSCDPLQEREIEDLAACTLVGRPRKRSHCLIKGQLAFEEKNNRLPDATVKSEVEFVLNYANELARKYFPDEGLFSIDDAVRAIDHHEPSVITINAVIASLQSQDIIRILHALGNHTLGTLPTKYTIYNGLTGAFFQFDKSRNPKCETCGPSRLKVFRMRVMPTMTIDMILSMLKTHGFDWKELPLVIRLRSSDLEILEPESTLIESYIKNKELILISGITKNNYNHDSIYLQLIFK